MWFSYFFPWLRRAGRQLSRFSFQNNLKGIGIPVIFRKREVHSVINSK